MRALFFFRLEVKVAAVKWLPGAAAAHKITVP